MSVVTRLGSVSLLNETMRDVSNVQSQLATLQEQISSGVKASTFKGLNGQVEQYTQLESKIRRTDQFTQTNEIIISRLNTADQAMSGIIEVADKMTNLIVTARGPNGAVLPFEQQMNDFLQGVANELNISFDGRFLFSGAATNTKPVPDISVPTDTLGTPDASYYAGSDVSLKLRADEETSFDFPIRADDLAFQKLFAAAKQAIEAFKNKDDAQMKSALDLMQSGQEDLNASRSRLGSTLSNVTNINDRLDTLSLYWKGVTEKVGKTDTVAAATQVASYEAVLQATYQVYARLSQLKLSDYLK